jgi:hypothetical protein
VLRVPDQAAKDQAFKVMVEGLKMAQGLLAKLSQASNRPKVTGET